MVRSRIISALDVGSAKIATLIAQIEEEGAINIIGSAATPSAGIKRGQVINIEEATRAIIASVEAAERMAGYSLTNTLVSVGGAHIVSQNSRGVVAVTNPGQEVVEEDVDRVLESARAISLPASREILHVLPRTYTVDAQEGIIDPIGMSGVRLEVETHIITASSTSLKNLQKCIEEVGTNVTGFVFDALASASTVATPTEKELGVTLVDIGGGTTSVAIFSEGAPIYSLVVPIGANNITNDLAIGLRLSIEDAERLKLALGNQPEKSRLTSLSKQQKNRQQEKETKEEELDLEKLGIKSEGQKITKKVIIEEIIRPRLEEIFGLIYDELKRNDLLELTPAGVVLAGGGAQTASVVEICRRTMALPVRIGIPQNVTGLIDDILTPEFAATIGLISYGQKGTEQLGGASPRRGGRGLPNLPIKSTFEKTIRFIKSFLP
ncbi:MAG: cell division protein FtsA [Candidatus Shapirobacteria bacterium]|nr:cell division protein FtsA [Candidatus Shapirobacteria bacterium]MDD5073960.1 cell division protein FtsA [Candidatus Shapirobacteria bacterium]MDD5481668.1 cell division protein FtsA [Candidatus Shapirobacteria bacterium]